MDGRKYVISDKLHQAVVETRDPFLVSVVHLVYEAATYSDDPFEIIRVLEESLVALHASRPAKDPEAGNSHLN